MQIKQSTHVWRSLFVTLTALLMCVSLAVTSFAAYVGEGGGQSWGGADATIGFSIYGHQLGYRIYLADSSTGEVKKYSFGSYIIKDIMSSNFDYSYATGDAMTYYGGYRPRTDQDAAITDIYSDTMPSGMPLAIEYSGGSWHGNGTKLHDWMMQDCTVSGYSGCKNVDMVIKKYLKTEAYTMVQEGKADFVIEPVYAIPVFKTRTTTKPSSGKYESYMNDAGTITYYCPWSGITFFGTWFESLEILTKHDQTHSFMNPVTTAVGNAMFLDENILGLKSAVGKIVSYRNYKTPSTIKDWGFGIHVYKSSAPPPTTVPVYYHIYDTLDHQVEYKKVSDFDTSTSTSFTPSTAYGTPIAACVETENPTTNQYTSERYRVREVGNPDKTDKLTTSLTVKSSDAESDYSIHVKVLKSTSIPVYYYDYENGSLKETYKNSTFNPNFNSNATYKLPDDDDGYTIIAAMSTNCGGIDDFVSFWSNSSKQNNIMYCTPSKGSTLNLNNPVSRSGESLSVYKDGFAKEIHVMRVKGFIPEDTIASYEVTHYFKDSCQKVAHRNEVCHNDIDGLVVSSYMATYNSQTDSFLSTYSGTTSKKAMTNNDVVQGTSTGNDKNIAKPQYNTHYVDNSDDISKPNVEGTIAGERGNPGFIVNGTTLKVESNVLKYNNDGTEYSQPTFKVVQSHYADIGSSSGSGNDLLAEYCYSIPTKEYTFNPSYLMTWDTAASQHQSVWMLSNQQRSVKFTDMIDIRLTQTQTYPSTLKGPWSTDAADLTVQRTTGLPTLKAGDAYSVENKGVGGSITIYAVLQDPAFADDPTLTAYNNDVMRNYSKTALAIQNALKNAAMYSNMTNASSANSSLKFTGDKMLDKEILSFAEVNGGKIRINGTPEWNFYALTGNFVSLRNVTGSSSDSSADVSSTLSERTITINGKSHTIKNAPSGYIINTINNYNTRLTGLMLKNPLTSTTGYERNSSSDDFSWYCEDYEGFVVAVYNIEFTIDAANTNQAAIYRYESDWRSKYNDLAATHMLRWSSYKIANVANVQGNSQGMIDNSGVFTLFTKEGIKDLNNNITSNKLTNYEKNSIYGIGLELPNIPIYLQNPETGCVGDTNSKVSFFYQPTYFNIRGSVYDTAR